MIYSQRRHCPRGERQCFRGDIAMKLQELQPDSKINITVTRGDTSATLSTTMVTAYGESILVEPFRHNGNIVSFDAPDLHIELVATKEGEIPYVWKNVRIDRVTYDNQTYQSISTGTIGVKLNRRGAFRVFIGDPGSVIDAKTKERHPVRIKDISSSGIGFLIDKSADLNYELGTGLAVIFVDDDLNQDFELLTRVVRRVELEDSNQILYGCMYTKRYPKVDRYCATKQVRSRQQDKKNNK